MNQKNKIVYLGLTETDIENLLMFAEDYDFASYESDDNSIERVYDAIKLLDRKETSEEEIKEITSQCQIDEYQDESFGEPNDENY